MNWEAISAIGEIIGAVTVVASLIYVGIQVRHNTLSGEATSREASRSANVGVLFPIAADPEIAAFLRKSLMTPEELDEDGQYRFLCLMYSMAENWEAAFSQWKRGVLNDHDWEKWITILGIYKSQPGLALFWTMSAGMFSREFRDYWESIEPVHSFSYSNPAGSNWGKR